MDDIELVRENQLEIVLLDDDNTELQRSTLTSGFLIDDLGALSDGSPKKLRVHLRSNAPSRTPRVWSLTIFRAKDVDVAIGPELAHFAEPRLGFSGSPPRASSGSIRPWTTGRRWWTSSPAAPFDTSSSSCSTTV